MSNQTITIEIPEGKVAKQVTNPDGSITISYVDKEPIRSKSWEEFCKNHPKCGGEFYITSSSSILGMNRGWNRHFEDASNCLATKEDAEGILALIKLTRLHDEWLPDEYDQKACIVIYKCDNEIGISTIFANKKLLSFPTSEMAHEFIKCFKDLILKAKKFI